MLLPHIINISVKYRYKTINMHGLLNYYFIRYSDREPLFSCKIALLVNYVLINNHNSKLVDLLDYNPILLPLHLCDMLSVL